MMTIGQSVELMYQAKTRVAQAKRNQNMIKDVEIMEGLVSLVETLQEALRNTASANTSARA